MASLTTLAHPSYRASAREHGWVDSCLLEGGDEAIHQCPRDAAACCPLLLLTGALLTAASHSKANLYDGEKLLLGEISKVNITCPASVYEVSAMIHVHVLVMGGDLSKLECDLSKLGWAPSLARRQFYRCFMLT